VKIFLFADNWVGYQVIKYLHEQDENIVGIALHPPEYQTFSEEIIKSANLPDENIFIVGKTPSYGFVDKLKELQPDIVLVVFWTFILSKSIFNIPKLGCINFHMSYLPFNRGKNPNVWPIVEGTPAGVSMHYIDSGIDSGKILFRREVEVDITDTAETLYKKQKNTLVELFVENWEFIKTNNLCPVQNIAEKGTFHWGKDFKQLDEIDLSEQCYPLELINHLRAKTFPPHKGAYFVHDGKKIFMRIELSYEE